MSYLESDVQAGRSQNSPVFEAGAIARSADEPGDFAAGRPAAVSACVQPARRSEHFNRARGVHLAGKSRRYRVAAEIRVLRAGAICEIDSRTAVSHTGSEAGGAQRQVYRDRSDAVCQPPGERAIG